MIEQNNTSQAQPVHVLAVLDWYCFVHIQMQNQMKNIKTEVNHHFHNCRKNLETCILYTTFACAMSLLFWCGTQPLGASRCKTQKLWMP
jgi:hypothetical protein